MSRRKTKKEWQIESDLKYNGEFEILEDPNSGQHLVKVLHKKCGNLLTIRLNNHLKRYCAYCSKKKKRSRQEWQKLSDDIHNSEFEILEEPDNGKTKIKILHKKCGSLLKMTLNNHINHKNGCKKCSKYSRKSHQYWINRCNEIWNDEFIILENISNVWQKVKVKHTICNTIILKDMSNLIHNKRGCENCSKKAYGEYYIKDFLDKEKIEYETQKKFEDLRNPKTGRNLYIDFWLPDFNIGLEIDGIQHRIPISHWGGEKSFKNQIFRDNIKNEYFKLNGLKLIRITNQELNKIKEIINEYCNKEKIKVKSR